MNILIVENERHAADKITRLLKSIDSTINITGVIETAEGTVNWLLNNEYPDLILMDIMLDDGLCFEIFETINIDIPVIFITAYNEYSLKAFKVNSVDYLLKPVELDALKSSLDKFRKYHLQPITTGKGIEKLINELNPHFKTRFLVSIGTKYRSLPVSEISYFHIAERSVFLRDKMGKDYGIDYSLDKLQKIMDPKKFFRINRECIISIDSISIIQSYSSSRLQLTLHNEKGNDLFVVSREKVSEFKKWVDR